MQGQSLLPALEGKTLPHRVLYWEHEGNRAVRDGKWKLVAAHGEAWQLHDMEADRTELHDLAGELPDKVTQTAAAHAAWAEQVGVMPWRPKRPEGYEPAPYPYPKTYVDLEG